MAKLSKKTLGEILVQKGLVTKKALADAVAAQEKTGKMLGKVLVEQGLISAKTLYSILEDQLDVIFKEKIPERPDVELFHTIPYEYCKDKLVAPVRTGKGKLKVYLCEPTNTDLINEIGFISGDTVEPDYATEKAIVDFLGLTSGTQERTPFGAGESSSGNVKKNRTASSGGQSAINYVSGIIEEAVSRKASDIHLEIYEKETRLRYRIDGSMHSSSGPGIGQYPAVLSRIKILAELDISEKRLPQDGRIAYAYEKRPIDIRVSIIPTVHGENAVLRILDKSRMMLDLDNIGFPPELTAMIKKEALKPNGMILITGPTGSGKTTTLYSILDHIKQNADKKILTIEDPVEYQMEGISQVHVHSEIGLTFAAGLRSFLRHDPDVMMIGEIRDKETAEIAIRAALTGHLVLSTVHTNDAAGTLTRFTDMGIPAYLLTSTVNLILSQRLARGICPKCKAVKKLTAKDIALYGIKDHFKTGSAVHYGKGCKACGKTGYSGRVPVFEWIRITEPVKKAFLNGMSSFELKKLAVREKMPDLRDSGLQLVKQGLTTLEEIEKLVSLGE